MLNNLNILTKGSHAFCVLVPFTFRRPDMITSQIERLKRDSRELGNYAVRLRKQGRMDILQRVLAKQAYLDEYIEEMEEGLIENEEKELISN